jgi:hypothetical protein
MLVDAALPVNGKGLGKLVDVLPETILNVLKGVAAFGVPLFDLDPEGDGFKNRKKPYISAKEATEDIHYGAVKDVARGKAFIVSGESELALDEAGVKYYALAAVVKVGADGKAKLEHRPISDLRGTNERIWSTMMKRLEIVHAREPPAICSRVMHVCKQIMIVARMYPGVDVLLFKKDIDDAFKRVHVNVADATSYATVLSELEGVEGESVMLSMVLLFGAQHSPGWFGVLAWACVAAWCNIGPVDAQFNGEGPFWGRIHVDDLVGVVPRIGSRPEIATERVLTR